MITINVHTKDKPQADEVIEYLTKREIKYDYQEEPDELSQFEVIQWVDDKSEYMLFKLWKEGFENFIEQMGFDEVWSKAEQYVKHEYSGFLEWEKFVEESDLPVNVERFINRSTKPVGATPVITFYNVLHYVMDSSQDGDPTQNQINHTKDLINIFLDNGFIKYYYGE